MPVPGATLTVTAKLDKPGPVLLNLMFDGIAGSQAFGEIVNAYAPQPALIRGVQPGRYLLRARTTDGARTLYGTQNIEMGNQDLRVDVSLVEPPLVSGKLRMEDGSSVPEGTYVELENEVERIHTRKAVAPDGAFQFEAMPPGSYRPLVGTSSKMFHLRAVIVDGAPAKQEMIEIARATQLELATCLSGGEIRGDVYRDGKPVEGVLALLTPRKESANPLDYRAFQTDADGSFEWTALLPGEYVLIVKEDWFDLEYANPVALRPLLNEGRSIRIEGAESHSIRVELK